MEKKSKRRKKFIWTEELIDKLIDLRYKKVKKLKEAGEELSVKNLWLDVPQSLGLPKHVTPDDACRKWNQLIKKYKAIQLKLQTGTCSHEEKAWPYSDRISDILEEQWTFDKPPQDSAFDVLQMAWEENKAKFSKKLKSDVWEHFLRLNRRFAQCKHCDKKLSFRTSISNLKKHLRVKHPPIFVSMDYFEEVEVASEDIGEIMDQNDDSVTDPDYIPEQEQSDILQLACVEIGVGSNNRRSDVWNSFLRIDNKYAQCRLCKKKFSYFSSISNLKRHLVNMHPPVDEIPTYPEEEEDSCEDIGECPKKKSYSKENSDNQLEKEQPNILQLACDEIGDRSNNRRSDVWKSFLRIDNKYAQCRLCKKTFWYFSSTSNLKRHLIKMHPPVDEIPTYPEEEEDSCEDIVECQEKKTDPKENSDNLLEKEEPRVPVVIQLAWSGMKSKSSGRHRSSVWEHYDRIDKKLARCKLCDKRLSYYSTITNLKKHLRLKHSTLSANLAYPEDMEVKSKSIEYAMEDSDPQPEKENSGETVEAKEVNMANKRSDVWKYFTILDHFYAKCNACKDTFSYRSTVSNLMKHRLKMHPTLKTVFSNQNKKTKRKDDETSSESGDCSQPFDDVSDTNENGEDLPDKNKNRNGLTTKFTDALRAIKAKKTSGLKESYLWNFFTIVDENFADCNMCHEKLVYRKGLGTLATHQRTKHPLTKKSRTSQKKRFENEVVPPSEDTYPRIQITDIHGAESLEEMNNKSRKYSYIWNFFTDLGNGIAECQVCKKRLSCKTTSSNLMKHRKYKHPEQPSFRIVERNGEKKNKIFKSRDQNQKGIRWFYKVVENQYGKQVSGYRPKISKLWQFFKYLDEDYALCKICNKKLSHKYTTANLMAHKNRIHPDVRLDHFSPPDPIESNETPTATPNDEHQQESNDGCDDHNNADCGPGSSNDHSDDESQPVLKLLRRKNEKSPIWRLFDRIDHTFAKCKFCNSVLSHRSTNSNLSKHIMKRHPDVFVKFKDMKNSVNTLVSQFFPEMPDETVIATNNILPPVSSSSSAPQQEIQIIIDGNQETFEYNNMSTYTLPVIYIQDEQNPNNMKIVTTGEMYTPTTSHITYENPAQVPTTTVVMNTNSAPTTSLATDENSDSTHFLNNSGNNVQVQTASLNTPVPSTSQNVSALTSTASSNVSKNIVQVPSTSPDLSENPAPVSTPSLHVSGNTTHVPSATFNVPENSAQVHISSPNMEGIINPGPTTSINTAQLPTTILNINGTTIQIPTHLLSGNTSQVPTNNLNVSGNTAHVPTDGLNVSGNASQIPTNILNVSGNSAHVVANVQNVGGNSAQVPPTSFNVNGNSIASTNDYLLSRLEENNKLMQEMQRTIDRQNDVLLRLAESISGRRERTQEEMLTD